MEKNMIAEADLNPEQKKLIATFREVFPKMVNVEVITPPNEKKKKSDDDDDE